jgi:methionine-S-sulfoxide reductase
MLSGSQRSYSNLTNALWIFTCISGWFLSVSSFVYPRSVNALVPLCRRQSILNEENARSFRLHAGNEGETPSERTVTTAQALFGLGCFWDPQQAFRDVPGVTSAVVGYANLSYKDDDGPPSYLTVCNGDGRTEAVLVEYNPTAVSYDQLLRTFWLSHDASSLSKAQYQSIIWPLTEEQRQTALKDVETATVAYQEQGMSPPRTVVADVPATKNNFVLAESIHQNFWSKLRVKALILAAVTLISSNGGNSVVDASITQVSTFLVLGWVFAEVSKMLTRVHTCGKWSRLHEYTPHSIGTRERLTRSKSQVSHVASSSSFRFPGCRARSCRRDVHRT